MAAYVVVQVDVKDPRRYEDYKKMVPPSIEKFGGRFLVRGGKTHTMEGGWAPQRFVLVEFPSVEKPGIEILPLDMSRNQWRRSRHAQRLDRPAPRHARHVRALRR